MKKNLLAISRFSQSLHSTRTVFAALFILLSGGGLQAQVTLFSASNLPNSALNANQIAVKQSYEQRANFSSIHLINLASAASIKESTEMEVQIPGVTTTYTFSATTLEAFSNGDFYWYGDMIETSDYSREVFEDECNSGTVSIIGRDGRIFGEMRIDTNYFQLPNLGNGQNALVKLDKPEGDVCISNARAVTPSMDATVANDRAICPLVRLLILYTQEALDAFPDIEDIGVQGYYNTVQALNNSDVDNLTLQLTGVKLLPGFSATGDWKADKVSILATNSTANILRNIHSADLVMILTPPVYGPFDGAVVAFGDSPAQADSAFAFIEANIANSPNYTITHEFGHLFGARHQRDDNCFNGHDNSGLQDAHAYAFNRGCLWWYAEYETVVSRCGGATTRILHYSNPDVKYRNHKTGAESWANNAKTIRNATCRISEYVVSHDLHVSISDPNPSPAPSFCPGNTFILIGTVNGDFPPYQYHWRYSLGSGPWITYSPVGPQNEFKFTIPANYWGLIYVELTVTNGTDQATDSNWVMSDYVKCNYQKPATPSFRNASANQNKGLICAPNPTSTHLNIRLTEYRAGDIDVCITNGLGKTCFLTTVSLGNELTNQLELDLPDLPNGSYILTIRGASSAPQVGKFTIIK